MKPCTTEIQEDHYFSMKDLSRAELHLGKKQRIIIKTIIAY